MNYELEIGREGLRKEKEKKGETRVSFGNRGHRSDLGSKEKRVTKKERKKQMRLYLIENIELSLTLSLSTCHY
jgi:hypothetical protein